MNQDNDAIENLEEKLKATRFRMCFDCEHFNKEDYTCDGKRLWTPKMFIDDWYQMTISHHPIGCKKINDKFASNQKKRDFDICKNCKHFTGRYDGGCFCWNTFDYRAGQRTWCRETNEEVSKELFEKATFDIWNKEECYYTNGEHLILTEDDK